MVQSQVSDTATTAPMTNYLRKEEEACMMTQPLVNHTVTTAEAVRVIKPVVTDERLKSKIRAIFFLVEQVDGTTVFGCRTPSGKTEEQGGGSSSPGRGELRA